MQKRIKHTIQLIILATVIFGIGFTTVIPDLIGNPVYAAENTDIPLDITGGADIIPFGTSLGMANNLPIIDKDVKYGDIVSFSTSEYRLSNMVYDPTMYGVVSEKPAISLTMDMEGSGESYPVVTAGVAVVNVSAVNGDIKKGDTITTSEFPGIGMKGMESGYILGTALEGFSSSDPKEIGKINVALNIHYFSAKNAVKRRLMDIANLSAIATYERPLTVFKYFVAALVVVLSIVFGFVIFGRVASAGVEAIGRNPLAKKAIGSGIILNVVMVIAMVTAGLFIGLLIIRL